LNRSCIDEPEVAHPFEEARIEPECCERNGCRVAGDRIERRNRGGGRSLRLRMWFRSSARTTVCRSEAATVRSGTMSCIRVQMVLG
jgi:hypothetical protein